MPSRVSEAQIEREKRTGVRCSDDSAKVPTARYCRACANRWLSRPCDLGFVSSGDRFKFAREWEDEQARMNDTGPRKTRRRSTTDTWNVADLLESESDKDNPDSAPSGRKRARSPEARGGRAIERSYEKSDKHAQHVERITELEEALASAQAQLNHRSRFLPQIRI